MVCHRSASNAVSVSINSRTRFVGQALERLARVVWRSSCCGFESSKFIVDLSKIVRGERDGLLSPALSSRGGEGEDIGDRGQKRSRTTLVAPGQTEDALGDGVALDFAGAAFDAISARAQIVERPATLVAIP